MATETTKTKRTYTKRTDKEKAAVDSIRVLVNKIDELEAENARLQQEQEEQRQEADKALKEYSDFEIEAGKREWNLDNKLILLKSLINIPETLEGVFLELVKTRAAYWDLLRDVYYTGGFGAGEDFYSWQDKENPEFINRDLEDVFN